MFTGIVKESGKIAAAAPGKLTITACRVLPGMEPGDSIAVNGVCLTVTDLGSDSFSVEVIPETLGRTNLVRLKPGDSVNLEPPLTLRTKLSGHLVQGHVDAMVKVVSVVRGGEMTIKMEASPELLRYIVEKGFVAVDGVSLTVVNREATSFQVAVIGYTRRETTLGSRRVGDLVNLEVDIIAKYVAQFNQTWKTGITVDVLEKHGFLAG
ncbi:riboflavin synthase [Chloroflexota bacterium]